MNNTIKDFYSLTDKTRTEDTERDLLTDILPWFEPEKSNNFLDIGCYDCSKTLQIASHIDAKYVIGCDFLYDRLEVAKNRNVDVIMVDLNAGKALPFSDSLFNCIFIGDVIEHVYSPDFLFNEIFRLLRPGAYAVLTTPNLSSWRNRIAICMGWQPFMTEVSTSHRVGNPFAPPGKPSGHIRVFTPRALRELIGYYGLQTERLEGKTIKGKPAGLMKFTILIDRFFLKLRSTLCDEIVVKVRKPLTQTAIE